MAEETDRSNKTQPPTEKKLRDARKKGDVPSSRETGNMMVVVSLAIIVIFALQWQVPNLVETLTSPINQAGMIDIGVGTVGLAKLRQIVGLFVTTVFLTLTPIFLILIVGAMFGVLLQGQTVVSLERIKPKLSKVSPAKGLKRLFSANTLVEFAKNLLKVLVVASLAAWVTDRAVQNIWEDLGFIPENLPAYMGDAARRLLVATAAFLVPIAIADILWRRFEWHKNQMMSVKEIRDEMKEAEGDPFIKGKRAALRRERSQQRIAVSVPAATVILANPTHYSVALKYDKDVDLAPVCVAKGADHMALQIREIASDYDVPIIENKSLARALFAAAEVGDMVPKEHWEVVAEIIGFLLDLQNNRVRKIPAGSTLVE